MRSKTSIYVDQELWHRFKAASSKKGMDASRVLEDLIRDEVETEELGSLLSELGGTGPAEPDFRPIRLRKGGQVSGLVREQRDERASLSR